MDVPGFSKVSGNLEDEEDTRLLSFNNGKALFSKAMEGYRLQVPGEEVLTLFEEAEASIAPYLQSGLTGLREKELELVLKGRLHQAVVLVRLEGHPERWNRVKALTEDVLQFDFSNCHARWIRGLALFHGFKKQAEAAEEMRNAVDCAKKQGKLGEVAQWEAEMNAVLGGSAASSSSAAGAEPGAAAEEEVEDASAAAAGKEAATAAVKSAGSGRAAAGMQKGFFNRPSKASSASTTAKAQAAAVTSTAQQPQEAAVAAAGGKEIAEMQVQLSELRRDSEEAERQRQEVDRQHEFWQRNLLNELEAMSSGFNEALEAERAVARQDRPDLLVALRDLRASTTELTERLQSDRTWAEGEHRAFLDCSTEVMTLREMTSRELKERQETSKQQVSEFRALVKSLGELKPSVKVLRERAKEQLASCGQEDEEPDLQRIAKRAMTFRALPASTRLAAFLDDAAMLRLMAIAMFLGMLLMLGIFIEAFGYYKCRFVCSA